MDVAGFEDGHDVVLDVHAATVGSREVVAAADRLTAGMRSRERGMLARSASAYTGWVSRARICAGLV